MHLPTVPSIVSGLGVACLAAEAASLIDGAAGALVGGVGEVEALEALLVLDVGGGDLDGAGLPVHIAWGADESLGGVSWVGEEEGKGRGSFHGVNKHTPSSHWEAQKVPLLEMGVVLLELFVESASGQEGAISRPDTGDAHDDVLLRPSLGTRWKKGGKGLRSVAQ